MCKFKPMLLKPLLEKIAIMTVRLVCINYIKSQVWMVTVITESVTSCLQSRKISPTVIRNLKSRE